MFFNKVRNPQPCEFGSSFCSVAVQLYVLILGYTRFDQCEFAEMNSWASGVKFLVETAALLQGLPVFFRKRGGRWS